MVSICIGLNISRVSLFAQSDLQYAIGPAIHAQSQNFNDGHCDNQAGR